MVEDERYGIDKDTKDRLARQLGIVTTGTTKKEVPEDDEIADMTLEELQAEIAVQESATGIKEDGETAIGEKRAVVLAQLKAREAELKAGKSSAVKGVLDRYKGG